MWLLFPGRIHRARRRPQDCEANISPRVMKVKEFVTSARLSWTGTGKGNKSSGAVITSVVFNPHLSTHAPTAEIPSPSGSCRIVTEIFYLLFRQRIDRDAHRLQFHTRNLLILLGRNCIHLVFETLSFLV